MVRPAPHLVGGGLPSSRIAPYLQGRGDVPRRSAAAGHAVAGTPARAQVLRSGCVQPRTRFTGVHDAACAGSAKVTRTPRVVDAAADRSRRKTSRSSPGAVVAPRPGAASAVHDGAIPASAAARRKYRRARFCSAALGARPARGAPLSFADLRGPSLLLRAVWLSDTVLRRLGGRARRERLRSMTGQLAGRTPEQDAPRWMVGRPAGPPGPAPLGGSAASSGRIRATRRAPPMDSQTAFGLASPPAEEGVLPALSSLPRNWAGAPGDVDDPDHPG